MEPAVNAPTAIIVMMMVGMLRLIRITPPAKPCLQLHLARWWSLTVTVEHEAEVTGR